jgi:hypothetical protein
MRACDVLRKARTALCERITQIVLDNRDNLEGGEFVAIVNEGDLTDMAERYADYSRLIGALEEEYGLVWIDDDEEEPEKPAEKPWDAFTVIA